MRARDYIQAIRELLREGHDPEAVFRNLTILLKRKGHEKLHAQILRGVSTQIEKDIQGDTALVTLAREHDCKVQKHAIESVLASMGTETNFEITIDPAIIGGFTAVQGGKIVDQSYKKQLLTLYRSLIS